MRSVEWRNMVFAGQQLKLIADALRPGRAVVLGLATVTGGLWASGFLVTGFILAMGLLVVIGKLWVDYRRACDSCENLAWQSCRQSAPNWLSIEHRRTLEPLARGAMLLLVFDRAPSGCWGRSYLYRRCVSGSSSPHCGGSLTGTPLALIAIGSATSLAQQELEEWAFESLNISLAKTHTPEGQYITGYHTGQTGRVPDFEPPRHAAGGLLISLLRGHLVHKDSETIKILTSTTSGPSAWDKAIVARALLHASHTPRVARKLRTAARTRHAQILGQLVDLAKTAPGDALIWADAYQYGATANNQWGSVWALLPSTIDRFTPRKIQITLRQTLTAILLAQEAVATANKGNIASRMEATGRGEGFHVFGTAISALAWNFLAAHPDPEASDPKSEDEYARRATERLVGAYPRLLAEPSCFKSDDPLSLEGYFAWAGILMAIASCGIVLSSEDARRVLRTTQAMCQMSTSGDESTLSDQYLDSIKKEGLFDDETTQIVGRSASRIEVCYETVEQKQRTEESAVSLP